MAEKTINAGVAAVKVLESWGVKHIYGIPGGSINSLMDALYAEKDNIDYIQVRHEEVGAMAASMHSKLTGHIGVAFGSAGPGGTHLLNGLYDAREDHTPVLALVGQFGTSGLNMDTFQEMNENPIYADVAVYNRQVSTAEQLPHIIDEAIRRAYAQNGVAVVQIPVDLATKEIPDNSNVWYDSAANFQKFPAPAVNEAQIDKAVELLSNAQRPLIYAGIGTRGAANEVKALAEKIKAPIITTAINVDTIPNDTPYWLGSAARVATKPANEAIAQADTVLFVGNNFPFAEVGGFFNHVKTFIQIDIDPAKLGKRHKTDLAILGDAKTVISAITAKASLKDETGWWKANIENNANWQEYLAKLENKTEGQLELFQVYKAIADHAQKDALFSVDVGDVTQTSVRHLHLNGNQPWRTSALFATMGVGVPGSIAWKLDNPDKQVWSISGDGAFNMIMQDVATQVQYKLPVINVVFANSQYGFIKDEQEDTNGSRYIGVEFKDVDYAKVADGLGAKGYSVSKIEDLKTVFDKAIEDQKAGKTIVIDAKIDPSRPIPAEMIQLDPAKFDADTIEKFKKRYQAEDLKPFSEYLNNNNVDFADRELGDGGF
ncbi:MAG: pyruvate oxidase [Lactobacillaceae bacterium]|jgi:pyruvate oxidase|nr:pyruvate oxidase [Lactobacillaceae bacterium]